MDFIISATSDAGNVKKVNQDSLLARVLHTENGKIVFAAVCDGVGGYSKGELASATVIRAFSKWMECKSDLFSKKNIDDDEIITQWTSVMKNENQRIRNYGNQLGIHLGTTATVMLITEYRYYILHVGDTRAYEIGDEGIKQLTNDQTVVTQELANGKISPEQAKNDPRRNVLLQCVGMMQDIKPEAYFGETKKDALYFLCSDGFCDKISEKEIEEAFALENMSDSAKMKSQEELLIDTNKKRNENDNISVVTIKTFEEK